MADGHLTPEPIENIFCGIASLRNLRLVIFLGKLNNLKLWGADIFLPSKADPCIWLKKAPNLKCYEYIAVYVDDLCIAAESPSAGFQVKVPFKGQKKW